MPNPREQEEIRADKVQLRLLSPGAWDRLEPLGAWEVPPLSFARGSARLTRQSEMPLGELVEKLATWPEYYVLVRGNALRDSDPEVYHANEALALQRAKSAEQYLIEKAVSQGRVRAIGVEPSADISRWQRGP